MVDQRRTWWLLWLRRDRQVFPYSCFFHADTLDEAVTFASGYAALFPDRVFWLGVPGQPAYRLPQLRKDER